MQPGDDLPVDLDPPLPELGIRPPIPVFRMLSSDLERMDYLEFIARVTSHIPNRGQVTVRYYGLYANAQISSLSSPTMPWWTESSTTSS